MRAGRLVNLLLTLQREGRMTAAELADQFEVSTRTVLRDVESLSEAGVPIFTTQGVGGGIELLDGFRTELTGLTDGETAALFLAGQPTLAAALGMAPDTATARQKLLESLTPDRRRLAERFDDLFVHDLGHRGPPRRELARLFGAADRMVEVDLLLGSSEPQRVQPAGLVLAAGQWWLVCLDHAPQRLSNLTGTRLTQRRFTRPPDFDLAAAWRRHSSRQAT
jgi:predicted DNA-binding transcriptional regulator YafY